MTNIFPFSAIENLIALEPEMNTSQDKHTYIKDSLTKLSEHMIKYFNKGSGRYLFHRAFYIADNKKFISVEIPHEKQSSRVRNFIETTEKEIDSELIRVSFTQLLNEHLKTGLCLYNGPLQREHRLKLNDFLFFDLDKGKSENVERFLHAEPKSLDRLLDNYGVLAAAFNPTYIYFIRPFTRLPHYNGSINLILQRPLSHAEYMEIGYVWTKILSDTAMVESKEEEQERIFEEHTHLSRIEFIALNQYAETIEEQLRDAGPTVYEASSGTIRSTKLKIKELGDAIEFNLYLMKSQQGNLPDNQFSSNESVGMIEAIDINELLAHVIENLIVVLGAQLIKSHLAERRAKRLEVIKTELMEDDHKWVTANYTGLRIIFTDLLKNAVNYSGDDETHLEIKVLKAGGVLRVHFINGKPLPAEAADYINNDTFSTKIVLTSRYGIRTIKRVLNSPFFQGQNCLLRATPQSTTGPTNIYVQLTDKSS